MILFCSLIRFSPLEIRLRKNYIDSSLKVLLWDIKDEVSANKYWEKYEPHSSRLTPEVKDLIVRMLSREPSDRPTIPEIKAHPFYKGIEASLEEVFTDGNKRRISIAESQ